MSDQNNNNYYGQQMPPQQQMPQQQMPQQQTPQQTYYYQQQVPQQQQMPQQQVPQQQVPQQQMPQQTYYQPQQGYYQMPGAPIVQAPYIPQQSYYQQPYYQPQQVPQQQVPQQQIPQQQQQVPQGQVPYVQGQPYYGAPVQNSAEPEVILQKSMFEEYGFSDEESAASNHNFGGFMEDTNEQPAEESLQDNIFTSTTPNYTAQDIEKMSKSSAVSESAFNSMTKNLSLNDVETASKVETDLDRDVFSNSVPVSERMDEEQPVVTQAEPVIELPQKEEPKPAFDFMASMQSMFTSMGNTATAAAVPAIPAAPSPEPAKPDIVVNAEQEATATIQDISSISASSAEQEEKGPEYWAYMNSLLDNFDDGNIHSHMEEERHVAVDTPVTEEKKHPFSEGAVNPEPATDIPAPQEPQVQVPQESLNRGIFINDVTNAELKPASAHVESVLLEADAETEPAPGVLADDDKSWLIPEDVNDKSLKDEAREKKAAEKEARKAQKAEEIAAKKAAKEARKAEKAQKKSDTSNREGNENIPETADDAVKDKKGFKKFIAKVFPVKGDPAGEIIRKIIVIVAFLVLVGCLSWLLSIFIQGQQNQKVYDNLSDTMKNGESSSDDWSSIYEKYPDVQFPSGMQTKFAELYATNSDIVGWLKIDGLGIDYPVVQTTDDAYYLKHDFMRNKSDYGTVFLSAGNNAKELDLNNVIYGHTMQRDNQMFTPLKAYKTIEGFKENPIIEYNTLYADYKFKVYAVFITNGSSSGDLNNYLFDYTFANLANTSAFAGFINQVNMRKLYTTGVSVLPDDKLLTLSTCTYEFDNARLVVIARLIRDGESEEIDFSKVSENENPRYPQAWYDANNQENPYKDEAQWRPTEAKTE